MKFRKTNKLLAILVLATFAGSASAISVVRNYEATTGCDIADCGTSGGQVTFTDTSANGTQELTIQLDNTSVADSLTTTGETNSALITGIAFDILGDINSATITTFEDGLGNDQSSEWEILFDVNTNITKTSVDITFRSKNGVSSGGIYNAADAGDNTNNAFPDIALLVLTVTDPASGWALQTDGISNDILRMQRVGLNGGGSLKIPGSGDDDDDDDTPDIIPEPNIVLLLGAGLGVVGILRRRRRS